MLDPTTQDDARKRHGLQNPADGDVEDSGGAASPAEPATGLDDRYRGKIPVEDRAAFEHLAREAMAAWVWVRRRRAAGRLPS